MTINKKELLETLKSIFGIKKMPLQKWKKININTNLISQELIQVAKFIGIGDLSLQRSIPLFLNASSSANFNGGVATGSRISG